MPTNETENYLRLHLLNNEAITVLRATFLNIVDKTCDGDVDKFLSEFKQEIIKQLKRKEQRDILFPANGGTDVEQWDVSLLCSILLSCCTLDGKLYINKLRELMKSQSAAYKDVDTFLGYNKSTIDQMKTQGVINEVQYDKLYPKNAKSSLNEWDVNLLVCILAQFSSLQNKQMFKDLLKNCISRDVRLYNTGIPDLTKYLKLKETKCKEMYQNGIIQQDQYNQLFPVDDGIPDVNNWDDHLLQMFATNVCLCLKQDTIAAIKVVKQIRNEMLAHKGSGTMETGEFLITWNELFNAIGVIVKEEVPQMSEEWKLKYKALNRDPFDISGAIGILIEYYSKETSEFNSVRDAIQGILRTIEIENAQRVEEHRCTKEQLTQLLKGQSDIAEAMQNLVGEKKDIHRYTVTIDVECIEVKIHVRSENESSKENTERAIRSSIQSALEGKKTEIKIETVSKLLEGITKEGSKVESVDRGSILLKIKCFSLKGITKLMLYIESQEHKNTIKEMEAEIDDDVELCCDISDASIQSIRHELDRIQDKYDGSKPLVCSRIDIDNDVTKTEVLVENISSEPEIDLDVKMPVFEKILTFDIICRNDTSNCVITSCTALPRGSFVICDFSSKNIKLYDKHCAYRSLIRLPNYPFDSCLSADDNTEVLVTVPLEGSIHRISVGDEMTIKGVIDLHQDCYRITCCALGIAVVVFDRNAGGRIHILKNDGSLVKRVCIALTRVSGITPIKHGTQLVISNGKLRSLTSVDIHTGKVVFTYEDEEELVYPGRVTSDSKDNIYVEEMGSNKVIMISCMGYRIGDILTYVDGLKGSIATEYNRFDCPIFIQPNWKNTKMCVYKLLK